MTFSRRSGKPNERFLKAQVLGLGLALILLVAALAAAWAGSGPSSIEPTPPPAPSLITETPVPAPTEIVSLPRVDTPAGSTPILAYYYIWFDPGSWNRAKSDYPLLGRYSSDDPEVMRQHVRWAKQIGLTGFIVSWKGTEKLNRRLDQLVEIADQENFKLAIIYESLDFERRPLPVTEVAGDLHYFMERYAGHPVFDLFGKPVVIWAGIWEFSTDEVRQVVQDKRDRLFVLASEKNVKGYQRVAELVDGDAYYWSSVDPETHPGYREKLAAMGEAVHAHGGLWFAPAAPGFDSRTLGGTTVIDRKGGETLRTEIAAALQSQPDAIALISWNEFSENSHIEPSENHGDRYLEVLAESHFITPNP